MLEQIQNFIAVGVLAGMFILGAVCGFVGAYLVARNNIAKVIEILQINPAKQQAEDFVKAKIQEIFGIKI